MAGRLIEIESCCGMEINMEKIKVMCISRQLSPVQITIKKIENVGCKV
jgi:hypothetical protein